MRLSIGNLYRLIALGCISAIPLFAQEQPARPEPHSIPIAPQDSEEAADETEIELSEDEAKKIGFVRLLDFRSEAGNQQLAIFLSDGDLSDESGQPKLTPLIRGSIPPDIRDHIQIPAGEYHILVRPETVTDFTVEDPEKLIPLYTQGQEVTPIRTMEVKPGEFQTIVLWGTASTLKLNIHVDQKQNEPRMLDLWNFLSDQPFVITGTIGGKALQLVESGPLGLQQKSLPVGPITFIELAYQRKTGTVAKLPLELEINPNQSIILIAFRDRYGRVAFRGLPGAPKVEVTQQPDL